MARTYVLVSDKWNFFKFQWLLWIVTISGCCWTAMGRGSSGSGGIILDTEGDDKVENLTCFRCFESFKARFIPDSPCLAPTYETVGMMACGENARYCMVERIELEGVIYSMERGCTDSCVYGCRFKGYGLTYKTCTSCCRGPYCNDDNSTCRHHPSLALVIAASLILLLQ